jgi:hypothetical protein
MFNKRSLGKELATFGVCSALLFGSGVLLGADMDFGDDQSAELRASPDRSPQQESAECFSLVGLQRALGPDGTSAQASYADAEGNSFGEVFVLAEDLRTATAAVGAALDPEADSIIGTDLGTVEALAAQRLTEQALPAVYDEMDAASADMQTGEPSDGGTEQQSDTARAMLDQAREQTSQALTANDCDPDLYRLLPAIANGL